MLKKWYYTILLAIVYLVSFHVFLYYSSEKIIRTLGIDECILRVKVVGALAFLMLSALLLWKLAYFLNELDLFLHVVVILDILLEAILIYPQDHLMFYGCAAAFAAVIVPFRIYLLRKHYKLPQDSSLYGINA